MKITITAPGIYGAMGKEVPVGTVLDVKKEPTEWAGRYSVYSDPRDLEIRAAAEAAEKEAAEKEAADKAAADKAAAEKEAADKAATGKK